jgi:hypothetical protein
MDTRMAKTGDMVLVGLGILARLEGIACSCTYEQQVPDHHSE